MPGTTELTMQETVERALSLASVDGCVVLAGETSSANLRWANNTLTTNGMSLTRSLTVIAIVRGSKGISSGVVSRSAATIDEVDAVVRAAERVARESEPAADARPLVDGEAAADWAESPAHTSIQVFDQFAPALGEALRSSPSVHFGFVQHTVTTTYLGSSTGLRLRHVQPSGYVTMTGKPTDRTRSAWVGQATRDFTDVDAVGLTAELERRLTWSERKVELPAGRYETLLPPAAVADLMIYTYWTMSARDAYEGRTVFSRTGEGQQGTRVGERLSGRAVRLHSDPTYPGLQCPPFVLAATSSSVQSVFDNGLPLSATDWVRNGELTALTGSRYTAELANLALTPMVGNLVVDVPDATASLDELIARTEYGVLPTSLWYIRPVDPQTLLLTGLTRDGVYLVENGEVTGEVNNFRFNESPVDLLDRFSEASETGRTFSREFGAGFPRVAAPALRIPDFNMSSVSQAS